MDDTYTNLLDIFMAATPDERQAGTHWYSDARAVIATLADETGINTTAFAGVVAALSPRVRWSTNLDAAARMCRAAVNGQEQPRVAGFGHNRDIAWQIANGGSFDLITGPKTSAFFQNLIGNDHEVTVDVWMLRAAGVYEPTKANIDNVTASIRKIARYRRLTPAQIQAIIWTTIRDRWNAND